MKIITAIACIFTGGYIVGREYRKTLLPLQKQSDKITQYYQLLNEWLIVRQKGITLDRYFERNSYKKIAIYGMGILGKRLFDELRETKVEIVCIIDQNAKSIYGETKVITPEEEIPEIDAIVVTACYYFKEVDEKLRPRVKCPVISLEEIVYESKDMA